MILLQDDNILALTPILPLLKFPLNILHNSNWHHTLILLQYGYLFSLVYGLNSLLNLPLKVKLIGLQRILNIRNFIQTKRDEVSIICLLNLLPVDIYLVAHEHFEVLAEISQVLGAEEELGVGKDYEVIGPRAFESLKTVIEWLTFRDFQQTCEKSLRNAYKLLMRVVGRPLVLSFTFVDLLNLVIGGLRLEAQLDISAYIKSFLRFFKGNSKLDRAETLE